MQILRAVPVVAILLTPGFPILAAGSPLAVVDAATRLSPEPSGAQLWLDFDAVNRSETPVTAWSVEILYGLPSGEGELLLERRVDCFLDPVPETSADQPHERGPLLPGQAHSHALPVMMMRRGEAGPYPVLKVSVTAVIFGDLTTWGNSDALRDLFEKRHNMAELLADFEQAIRMVEIDPLEPTAATWGLEALDANLPSRLLAARRERARSGQLTAYKARVLPKDPLGLLPWLLEQYLAEARLDNMTPFEAYDSLLARVEGYREAAVAQVREEWLQ